MGAECALCLFAFASLFGAAQRIVSGCVVSYVANQLIIVMTYEQVAAVIN